MARPRLKAAALVRWLIQLGFLGLFVFLFIQTRYGAGAGWQSILFRLDPLVFVITSIAQRAVLTTGLFALVIVIGTLVFGRLFCGYVCPMGTVIDLSDAVLKAKRRPASAWRAGKYLVLIVMVVAALLGGTVLASLDPLTILQRSLVLVFYPAATHFAGALFHTRTAYYTGSWVAFGLLAAILALGLASARFWCRNLCPLGGFAALASKFSLFKFRLSGECRQCLACEKACPTGAIDVKAGRLDSGECIGCRACLGACPDKAIRYTMHPRPQRVDVSRRQALVAIGSGIVLLPLAKNFLYQRFAGRLIRPPGAVPEPDFQNLCIRCGQCLKVCPTNGLQPCLFEAGAAGLWTPRLVPRVGGCEKNCNSCGQVCPTGAIRRLPLEEKSFARMGTAVVDKSRCIAWEQDRHCLVCDEACPIDAIAAVKDPAGIGIALRPKVDDRACIGCGLCESRCPVGGPAAIQVFSMLEVRKRTGAYATEELKRLRECGQEKQEEIPSGFIQE